jgi:hypothetical protein
MKLITDQLKQRFAAIGSQRNENDPIVVAKFFNPCGSGTWYAMSYEPESNTCFGYVEGLGEDELGTFSIDELEAIRIQPWNMGIERDTFFKETKFSELSREYEDYEVPKEIVVEKELPEQEQNVPVLESEFIHDQEQDEDQELER